MSGGSLDYVSGSVGDAAGTIMARCSESPLHRAFAEHLNKVAAALHACEWVLSCDWGKGDDEEAIRAVLAPGAELDEARRMAEEAVARLSAVLAARP